MLLSAQRLRDDGEVMATIKQGRPFQVPGLRIYIRRQPQATQSRVACVVGKRIDPRSVVRHRYQRWLRVLARELLAQPTALSVDMVWVAQPAIKQVPTLAALRARLQPVWNQLIPSK